MPDPNEPVEGDDSRETLLHQPPPDPVDPRAFTSAFTTALASGKLGRFDPADSIPQSAPSLLLLAATLDQNGFNNEAAAIARALIDKLPDPQALVVEAVNILADTAREDALMHFIAGGKWADYADALEKLRRLYGPRWRGFKGVSLVGESARAREVGFSLPDLSGWPEAAGSVRALVADKAVPTTALLALGGHPWVIAPPPAGLATPKTDPDPVAQLLDGGMAAVPALLELATNATQLRLSASLVARSADPMQRFVRSARIPHAWRLFGSGSPDGDQEEDAAALARPATLGELATRLLRNIMPGPEDEEEPRSIDAIRRWYDNHQSASRQDLAFEYFQDGSSDQQNVAMAVLLAEGGNDVRHRLADNLLARAKDATEPDAFATVALATVFVGALDPSESKAFVDRFAAAVRDALLGPPRGTPTSSLFVESNREDKSYLREHLNRMLKSLREAASRRPVTLHTVLDSLLADETRAARRADWSQDLAMAMQQTGSIESMSALTNAICRARTAPLRCNLLAMLPYIDRMSDGRDRQDSAADATPPWRQRPSTAPVPHNAFPEAGLSVFWREMLADSRGLDDDSVTIPSCRAALSASSGGWDGGSVASVAAWSMELINDTSEEIWFQGRTILGRRWNEQLVARATARLDGLPPVAMPSAEMTNAVDHAALEAELNAVPASALPAAVHGLETPKLIALALTPCSNATLRARLGAAASRIVAAPPGFGIAPGAPFTTSVVERVIAAIAASPVGGQASILRGPALAGIRVGTNTAADGPLRQYLPMIASQGRAMGMPTNCALFAAFAMVPDLPEAAGQHRRYESPIFFWALDSAREGSAGTPANPDAEIADTGHHNPFGSIAEQQQRFWKRIGLLCDATCSPLEQASVQIQIVPAGALQQEAGETASDSTNP